MKFGAKTKVTVIAMVLAALWIMAYLFGCATDLAQQSSYWQGWTCKAYDSSTKSCVAVSCDNAFSRFKYFESNPDRNVIVVGTTQAMLNRCK